MISLLKKRSFFASNVALVAIVLLTGSSEPSSESFSAPWFEGRWENYGRRFIASEKVNPFSIHKDKNMVMVSFSPLSQFATYLKQQNSTLAYYSSVTTGIGRAVVRVDSEEKRIALASMAHDNIHACGAIEDYDLAAQAYTLGNADSPAIPTSVKANGVSNLISAISADRIRTSVSTLENLGTRYHAAAAPNSPSDAVKRQWEILLPANASIKQVDHSTRKQSSQKSVVLRIPGLTDSDKTIVLGAHLDSINKSDQNAAPGADDDASGIAALTEILHAIKSSGATFARTIEFHAYAAEEVGLWGSSDLASQAKNASQNIASMLQLDMVGYASQAGTQTIHIIKTDTSPVLVRHLKDLASVYLGGDWLVGELQAGTSDHKSWSNFGFHAAFVFEHPTDSNRAIHTAQDTSSRLDFTLATRFTKLAAAFLAHEAGLTSAITDAATAWAAQQAKSEDITLAVSPSKSGNYRVAAASVEALNAASAELCKLQSGSEFGCQSLNTDTSLAARKSGRSFFVTTDELSLADADIWRVNFYDAQGLLVGMRTFKLRKT
jgi:leucyl aminopeptidase